MKQKITFKRDDLTLVGNLFTPDNFDENGHYKAVLVQGSFSSVKEQMAGTSAEKLAAEGFVALTFDYAHYGESEGAPRQLENPAEKLADLEAAVTYLLNQPFVDATGMVGVCTSASNGTQLAAKDTRIKAYATVAAALFTPEAQAAVGEEVVADRLAQAEVAKKKWDETGEQTLITVYSETGLTAVNYIPFDGAFDYYENTDRGNVPTYRNEFDVQSWPAFLAFDGVSPAPQITAPVMVVHSDESASPEVAKAYFESITAEKELVWGDGNHYDYYDSDKQISFAVENLSRFFNTHVAA